MARTCRYLVNVEIIYRIWFLNVSWSYNTGWCVHLARHMWTVPLFARPIPACTVTSCCWRWWCGPHSCNSIFSCKPQGPGRGAGQAVTQTTCHSQAGSRACWLREAERRIRVLPVLTFISSDTFRRILFRLIQTPDCSRRGLLLLLDSWEQSETQPRLHHCRRQEQKAATTDVMPSVLFLGIHQFSLRGVKLLSWRVTSSVAPMGASSKSGDVIRITLAVLQNYRVSFWWAGQIVLWGVVV